MRWIVPPFNARTTRDEDEGTLVFSAPGLNAISYTRTLSLSSSTFCVAVALAAFCCAVAEFTTAPANRNAGTSSPARTAASLLMISPFSRQKWRRELFYAPQEDDGRASGRRRVTRRRYARRAVPGEGQEEDRGLAKEIQCGRRPPVASRRVLVWFAARDGAFIPRFTRRR